MDPTGLTIGVVGLAGLVSTCIEAFQILRSIRAFSRDTEILFTKLDIEKELFLQWAQQVGLLKKRHVDGRLFDRRTDALIYRVLQEIKGMLTEARGMEGKYVQTAQAPQRRVGHHYEKRERYEDEWDDRLREGKKVGFGRKFVWTVHGRDELKSLIDELGYFIGKLYQMIPSVEQRKANVKELRDARADVGTLSTLMLAEPRTERGSDDDDWSDLVSDVASEAGRRTRAHASDADDRRRRPDEEYEDRRCRSESTVSRSSSSSFNGSSNSYRSSRSTLVEMVGDVVGSSLRPRSTWR